MADVSSRQLRAFLLVAEHRSFSRAAEALFITPSGLSVLVRELERQVGFRLFDRTTRRVDPTAHGREFLVVARRMLLDLDAATSRIGRAVREAGTTLSVGAGLLVAANILPQAIKEFTAARPDVAVRLFDAGPQTILRRVRAGTLDIGLGFFPKTSGVRRLPFFRFSLLVIRQESAASPPRPTIGWPALKAERLILQAPPAPVRTLIDRHLVRAGVDPGAAIDVNRLETLIAMVEAGFGVGVVPSFALPVCRRRNLGVSRLVNPDVPVDLFQIRNRGRKLGATAEDFTAFLQTYIARWAGRAGIRA